MARPKKLNSEYFSHDVDMRNDNRIKALRRKYQHKGYAFWNMILELLGDSDYFEYEWTDLNVELLAPDFDIDSDDIKDMVNYCITLDLLQIYEGMLTCDKFTERLTDTLMKKRPDFSLENSTRFTRMRDKELHKAQIIGINSTANAQSKAKESKLQDTKPEHTTLHDSVGEESKLEGRFENPLLVTNESSLDGDDSNTESSEDSFKQSIKKGLQIN